MKDIDNDTDLRLQELFLEQINQAIDSRIIKITKKAGREVKFPEKQTILTQQQQHLVEDNHKLIYFYLYRNLKVDGIL